MRAYDIRWDASDGQILFHGLPSSMDVPDGITDPAGVAEYLTETTGFTQSGFRLGPEDDQKGNTDMNDTDLTKLHVAAWVRGHEKSITAFAEALSAMTGVVCAVGYEPDQTAKDCHAAVYAPAESVDAVREAAHDRAWLNRLKETGDPAACTDGVWLSVEPVPLLEWSDERSDAMIFDHGRTFAWGQGRNPATQKFVEALSRRIMAKCDWSYAGGRSHFEALPGYAHAAAVALRDEEWLARFLVPYTDESWENGTFFRLDTFLDV